MRTFNVINQWIEKGNTKRIAQFELQGMCPECHGKALTCRQLNYIQSILIMTVVAVMAVVLFLIG